MINQESHLFWGLNKKKGTLELHKSQITFFVLNKNTAISPQLVRFLQKYNSLGVQNLYFLGTPCTCKFTVDSIEIICLFHLLSECASILTNAIGRIISPGFPQQYYNNIDCSWLIQYHPESFIRLVFLSFDVRCR